MKQEHITLPTLQLAAAAFYFIAASQAAPIDESTNAAADNNLKILPRTGSTATSDPTRNFQSLSIQSRAESSNPIEVTPAGPSTLGLVSGGFGKRDPEAAAKKEDEKDKKDHGGGGGSPGIFLVHGPPGSRLNDPKGGRGG